MNKTHLIAAAFCLAGFVSSTSHAAVQLSSLSNPTLQTLMTMGSNSVIVGSMQFSNFSFTDDSTNAGVLPSQIRVESFSATGNGLEFVAGWYASNGNMLNDVVSFDVQTTVPGQSIGEVTLLTNGTAPVAAPGTFITASLLSQNVDGSTAAPVISTFNSGANGTANNNFASTGLFPQPFLFETATLFGNTETTGVVTATILETSFVAVPEPRTTGLMVLPMLGLMVVITRPLRRPDVSGVSNRNSRKFGA